MLRLVIAALILALAAPAFADTAVTGSNHAAKGHVHDDHAADAGSGHDADDDHVAAAPFGLRATHAWSRATTDAEALVFVEIENRAAKTIVLTGAASAEARAAELVGFRLADGAPVYDPVPQAPIEPGAEIVFAPYGLAIRIEGLTRPLVEGGTLSLTLLTDAGALPVVVAIEAADARRHSHAGHAHD